MENAETNKSVTEMIQEIAELFCDQYCRYPREWDEEKEGIALCDSDVCKNCPIVRL